MKYKIHALLLLLAIVLAACSSSPVPLKEPDILENIIGEWRYDDVNAPLDFAHWFIFSHESGPQNSGICSSSRGDGIWHLSGTTLHIEIIDNRHQLEGINASYTILSLTNKKLVLKNAEDSETYSLHRPDRN